jgi:uncharacterized integral membrane protein
LVGFFYLVSVGFAFTVFVVLAGFIAFTAVVVGSLLMFFSSYWRIFSCHLLKGMRLALRYS